MNDAPRVFLVDDQPSTAVIGPGDPIRLPAGIGRIDFESEVAVVIAQNLVRRLQPRIMVVKDANGNPLIPYKMLDLMKEPKVRPDEPYRIQRTLEYDSVKIDPRELFL